MRLIFFSVIVIFLTLFSGIFDSKAHAYLDPGTGSYVFQILIAFVVGGLFAIKIFWSKIIIYLKNLFSSDKNNG